MRQVKLWLIAITLSGIGILLCQDYGMAKLPNLKILFIKQTT